MITMARVVLRLFFTNVYDFYGAVHLGTATFVQPPIWGGKFFNPNPKSQLHGPY